MVFQNKVVKEMVGKISSMDLQTFLDKPIFLNQEDQVKVSLMAVASKRHSETFISQPFEVIQQAEQPTDPSKTPQHNVEGPKIDLQNQRKKIFSFTRNEVIFRDQQCIVLNIRDLTEQHTMLASSAQTKQLISAVNA